MADNQELPEQQQQHPELLRRRRNRRRATSPSSSSHLSSSSSRIPTLSVELGLYNNNKSTTNYDNDDDDGNSVAVSSSSSLGHETNRTTTKDLFRRLQSMMMQLDDMMSKPLFQLSLPPVIEGLYSIPACFFGLIPPIVVGPPLTFLLSVLWLHNTNNSNNSNIMIISSEEDRYYHQRLVLLMIWTTTICIGFVIAWSLVLKGHASIVGRVFAVKPMYIVATPFNLILLRYVVFGMPAIGSGSITDSTVAEADWMIQQQQQLLSSCIYSLFLWYPSIFIVLILKDVTNRRRPCLKLLQQQQQRQQQQEKVTTTETTTAPAASASSSSRDGDNKNHDNYTNDHGRHHRYHRQDYETAFSHKTFRIIPVMLSRSGGREGYKSFPSGDATSSVCFAIPIAYLSFHRSNNNNTDDWASLLPMMIAISMVVLSCTGRVYFLAHHVLDVVVGAIIPMIFHILFSYILDGICGIYDLEWWYPLISITFCLSTLGTIVLTSKVAQKLSTSTMMIRVNNVIQRLEGSVPFKIFIITFLVSLWGFSFCNAAESSTMDSHHHQQPRLLPRRRPFNAVQLAVGTWDVKVCRVGLFGDIQHRIFPSSSMIQVSKNDGTNRRRNPQSHDNNDKTKSKKNSRLLESKSHIRCRLSVAEDGTFVLQPKNEISSLSKNEKKKREKMNPILPVRGEWKIMPNPHCATDRFYDEISFMSYRSQQLQLHRPRSWFTMFQRCEIQSDRQGLQTIQLNLRGRMWGRYGLGRGRRTIEPKVFEKNSNSSADEEGWDLSQSQQYNRQPHGKLTHGTLTWIDIEESPSDNNPNDSSPIFSLESWRRRKPCPVVASVSGRRISTEPSHEGWIDD